MDTWDTVLLGTYLDHEGTDEIKQIMEQYVLTNPKGIAAAIRQAMWLGLIRGFELAETKAKL